MWWKIGIFVTITAVILGTGWYLYKDNVKKAEDVVVMQCDTSKLEADLKAANDFIAKETLRADSVTALLKASQEQVKSQNAFIAKTRVTLATIPDDKLGDRSKELLRLLSERSAANE